MSATNMTTRTTTPRTARPHSAESIAADLARDLAAFASILLMVGGVTLILLGVYAN